MNGTLQAILFILGVAFVGFGLLELAMIIGGALTGLIFPLLIGAALIAPAVSSHKRRKALRRTARGILN